MTAPPKRSVAAALAADEWEIAKRREEGVPLFLRYRTPILGPDGVEGYGRLLRILWPFETENSGALPSTNQSSDMELFEDRLCGVLETDSHAFLAAVLTFDGARQWVFHTSDVGECQRRLEGKA